MTDPTDEDANELVEVCFEVPPLAHARSVSVVGEFNDWVLNAHPMQEVSDGSFRTMIPLAAGRMYRYRYWVDDERWENDWQADLYLPNPYGGDDSAVDLTEGSPRRQRDERVQRGPDRRDEPQRRSNQRQSNQR